MAKKRVYEIAKVYEIPSKAFVDLLNKNNIPVKNHMSMLTDSQVNAIKEIEHTFSLESAEVQAVINRHKKIESQEKIEKEKAEAAKQEELRRKKAHDRVELAKANREQQEAEQKEAMEAERQRLAKEAKKQAALKAQQEKAVEEAKAKAEKAAAKAKAEEEKNKAAKQKAEKGKTSEEKTVSEKKKKTTEKQDQKPEPKQKEKSAKKSAQESSKERSKKTDNKKEAKSFDTDDKKPMPSQQGEIGKGKKKKNKKENHIDSAWEDQEQSKHNKKDKKEKKKQNLNQNQNQASLKVRDHSKKGKAASHASYKKQKDEIKSEKRKNQVFEINETITVGELAETIDVGATTIIMTLMGMGTMATINQEIDFDTAAIVAEELGYKVEKIAVEDVVSKILEEYDEEDTGNAVKRPPVVTVMGHVDHGKTSLLDRIRQSNVTAGEAGGITQHIGAYTVTINGEKITFIDTPGHEAFTAMRLRGAQMTDIAVLVVAADDGVMPQTVEAINHAKAANVPIIVAINKIDKDGANPERVKQELTEHNLVVEEWGGDVIAVPVSAKKGIGIEDLLENILLVAEVGELTADPKRPARGCVIEAQMKQGKGSTASLLVQQGTLHVGDTIISGMTYGKVRTMIDDKGRRIKKAGPSQPVEISGLSEVPVAGDDFIVLANDKEARQLAEKRQQMEKDARQNKLGVSLNDLFDRIQEGQIQDVNIIIKADVQGSVEAIAQSLVKLNTDEVRINVIHGAVGAVNESDVMLASTSGAIIIGFNVRPDKNAVAQAETEHVDIRLYRVIYDAIEDVKQAMAGLLSPEYIEKVTGAADVREVFRIPGGTMIAGSYVTEGKIGRNDEARVIRDGIVIFEGKLASLRRFKDDVKEVNNGYECGIGIEKYNDIKVGDVIETFVMEAVAREL